MSDAPETQASRFRGCFGCGEENPIGLRLAFETVGNRVIARTRVRRDYAGYRDFAHGGIVATMLDEAMGWAMVTLAKRHGVTKSLRISFRRPVLVDREITVGAEVVGEEQDALRLRAWIADDRGRRLAEADGEWVGVREERALA